MTRADRSVRVMLSAEDADAARRHQELWQSIRGISALDCSEEELARIQKAQAEMADIASTLAWAVVYEVCGVPGARAE